MVERRCGIAVTEGATGTWFYLHSAPHHCWPSNRFDVGLGGELTRSARFGVV